MYQSILANTLKKLMIHKYTPVYLLYLLYLLRYLVTSKMLSLNICIIISFIKHDKIIFFSKLVSCNIMKK